MNDVWKWVLENWVTIFSVVTSVVGTAAIIAKATPNPVDNAIVDWLIKLINIVGMNFGNTKNLEKK